MSGEEKSGRPVKSRLDKLKNFFQPEKVGDESISHEKVGEAVEEIVKAVEKSDFVALVSQDEEVRGYLVDRFLAKDEAEDAVVIRIKLDQNTSREEILREFEGELNELTRWRSSDSLSPEFNFTSGCEKLAEYARESKKKAVLIIDNVQNIGARGKKQTARDSFLKAVR